MRGQSLERHQLFVRCQLLWNSLAPFLAFQRQNRRLILKFLDDVICHSCLFCWLIGDTASLRCHRRLRYRRDSSLRLQGRQSFSRGCHLFVEACYDATCRVVLVQSVTELLPGCLQLLSLGETIQHHRIPLVLEEFQRRRNAGGARWFRLDDRGGYI